MKTERLNAADYLGSGNAKVEYITAAYETGDPEFIRDAYNLVARARGDDPDRRRDRFKSRKPVQGAWRAGQSRIRHDDADQPRTGH
jgi:hypothetical protein